MKLGSFSGAHRRPSKDKMVHVLGHEGGNDQDNAEGGEEMADLEQSFGESVQRGNQRPVLRTLHKAVPADNQGGHQEKHGDKAAKNSFGEDKTDIPSDGELHQGEGNKANDSGDGA